MRVEIYGCKEGKTIDLSFCCTKLRRMTTEFEFVLLFKSALSNDTRIGLVIALQRQEIHKLFFHPSMEGCCITGSPSSIYEQLFIG